MMGANVFGLESIVLDCIELFADGGRMPFPGISNALKRRAVNLRTLG